MQSKDCPHYTAYKPISLEEYPTVFRDECAKCFSGNEEDLYVCLTCLSPGCTEHIRQHYWQFTHYFALKFPAKPHQDDEDSDVIEEPEVVCLLCKKTVGSDKFEDVIDVIEGRDGHQNRSQEENKPCPHSTSLTPIVTKKLTDKDLEKCIDCDLTTNLWFCLWCGNLACGRQQFDHTGGNGHARNHYWKTGHNIVVKMGTVTKTGNASVHCYDCSDEIDDDGIAEHLAHFGIHIDKLKKTEKTIEEINNDKDLSLLVGAEKMLPPLFGKGYNGIQSMQRSSYMNAVLQLFFTIDEFKKKYCNEGEKHLDTCMAYSPDCWKCQLSKIGVALCGDRYSRRARKGKFDEDTEEVLHEGIKPHMFKKLFAKRVPQMRYQDAIDFMKKTLSMIQLTEQKADDNDITEIFDFEVLICSTCQECHRYTIEEGFCYDLPMKPARSQNSRQEVDPFQTDIAPHTIPIVSFEECLKDFQQHVREGDCATCNRQTEFKHTFHLKTWPKYLLIEMNHMMQMQGFLIKDLSEVILDSEIQDFSIFKVPDMDPKLLSNNGGKEINLNSLKTKDDKSYKYQLKGLVSHFGYSFPLGQYACYAKKEEKWAYFCDTRVGESKKPRFENACIYLFEKCNM